MKYTKNYNFKKPGPNDTRNIDDINESFDMVDAKLKETQDKNTNLDETFKQLTINAGSSNAEIVLARRDNINNKTYGSVPERLDGVASLLQQIDTQKATKEEINALGQLKLEDVLATLTELETTYPTGAEGLYLVTEDGYTYRWNGTAWVRAVQFQSNGIANFGITPEKLSKTFFYEPGNLGEFELGTIDLNTGDAILHAARLRTKGYIKLCKGDLIINLNKSQYQIAVNLYGLNDYEYLDNIGFSKNIDLFTVPYDCYVRLVTAYKDNREVTEADFQTLSENIEIYIYYQNIPLKTDSFGDKTITPQKTTFLVENNTVNLFDKTKVKTGGYYSSSTGAWTSSTTASSEPIYVESGDIIRFKAISGGGYHITYWNSDMQFIGGKYLYLEQGKIQDLVIPINACYCMIPMRQNEIEKFMIVKNMDYPISYVPHKGYFLSEELTLPITKKTSAYKDKYLSILSDSISTYIGYIPSKNITWYTGSNGDVTSVDQTWWMRLINQSGMKLCVNNSWSASRVTSTRGDESGALKRVNLLHTDINEPDVIIIFMGINDFNNEVQIGSYDGHGNFPTDTTSFREAYAIMLNQIMTRYKNCEIYCCTLPYCERSGGLDFPETNDNGVILSTFNDAIRELADLFGANILEFSKAGITYQNKTLYTIDELHPNSAGHELLAKKALKTIF